MASVKLSDIAHKLGTSTVTVSNAINGKGSISPELRRKILQTAQDMGYQRRTKLKAPAPQSTENPTESRSSNVDPLRPLLKPYDQAAPNPSSPASPEPNASATKSGPSSFEPSAQTNSAPADASPRCNRQIGILIAQRYLSVGASFYWNLYQHTATTAASFGISSTILQVSDEQVERGELPHLLTLLTNQAEPNANKALQLDGLIIMGPFAHDYLKLLTQLPLPCTLLDYYDEDLELSAVLSHNYINSYQITRYVIKKGHTRLGFIGNRLGFDNIADRCYGFERALMLSNLEFNPAWVIDDREPVHGQIYEEIPLPKSFVPTTSAPDDQKVPAHMPTAFVCNCDYSAAVLQRTLLKRGFRVPEDISIVGYDNFLTDSSFAHELTTLDVNLKLMAQFAVSNMNQLLQGQTPTSHIRRLEGHIIERRSVRTMSQPACPAPHLATRKSP